VPVFPIKKMNPLQRDLLRATVYVLDRNGYDIKNAYNVVTVLARMYYIDDLEQSIVEVARSLEGLQVPSAARVYSPGHSRDNIEAIYPYVQNQNMTRHGSKSEDKKHYDQEKKKEDDEVGKLQYKEPEQLPEREDIRKRSLPDKDPDIDHDYDVSRDPDTRRNADLNLIDDMNFSPPREHLRHIRRRDAELMNDAEFYRYGASLPDVLGSPIHDNLEADRDEVLQSGILYFTFKKPASNSQMHTVACREAEDFLYATMDGLKNEHPNVILRTDYWLPTDRIGAVSLGFNQVHADPDEFALNYAITSS